MRFCHSPCDRINLARHSLGNDLIDHHGHLVRPRGTARRWGGLIELPREFRQLRIFLVDLAFQRRHLALQRPDLLVMLLKFTIYVAEALPLLVHMRGDGFGARDFLLQAF